jgi:uncharacterized protein
MHRLGRYPALLIALAFTDCTKSARETRANVEAPMPEPEAAVPTSTDAELLEAARRGDVEGTKHALARGANVEASDSLRRTALALAVISDFVDVARVLVERGASPNALDARHDTPWLLTGETGSVAMVEALLPGKPDFAIVNRFGGISVIPASERGHVEYVRRVVKLPINVDHVNNLGWTALLECVLLGDGSKKYQEIAQILKDAGADVHIRDRDGVDAVEHARRKAYHELVNILSR